MNTHPRKKTPAATWLFAAAFAVAFAPSGMANEKRDKAQADTTHGAGKIQIAPAEVDRRTAETFTGRDVRGSGGDHIGNLSDVIVDRQTGRIAFFVVSSGGVAGIGDTLRLVPQGAMKRATNDEGFTVSATAAQWEKMPIIDEQDFEADRIDLTADQQRQLADLGGNDPAFSDDPNREGDFGPRFARAAKLRGLPVRANAREVGEIEAIVLDLDRGTATALMEADDDFAQADDNFLVPLGQFQFTDDRDALTTTLTAADFPRANADDVQLTPTGRANHADPNANTAPALQSAARSVRQVWDAHPDLAKLDLRVNAENGKLVFRGNVPTEDLWERAKDTAESVVTGIEIENRISTGNRAR